MFIWTKEKPTEPGWYWMRKKYFQDYDISVEHVREYGGKLYIMNWEISDNVEWAGPIPKPKEGGIMAKESRSEPGDAGYGAVSELGEKYGIKTSSLDLALCWPMPFIEKLFEEITELKAEIVELKREG